jgi:pyruvate, water dikinase
MHCIFNSCSRNILLANVGGDLKKAVESVARGHASTRAFYVDKVAEGVATIAAAFWPKPVIVRLSDFKSNEYRKLIGGSRYEPDEENPMLGFRGAARYISADFGEAFAMECEAIKRVRNDMGLTNVEIMVPFVRTLGQAHAVSELLSKCGLARGTGAQDGTGEQLGKSTGALRHIMMCEVPSNAILQSHATNGHQILPGTRQIRRHLRPRPQRPPRLCAVAG